MPPHLETDSLLAFSIAALILLIVAVSLLGMMAETLYLGSLPLTLSGSQQCRKEKRHGMMTLLGFLLMFIPP